VGRFEGAAPLPMRKFTQFAAIARKLVDEHKLRDRCVCV
jgi:predicted sulfurtransferase